MSHLPILPILIPLLAATALLLPPLHGSRLGQRWGALLASSLTLLSSLLLVSSACRQVSLYALGDWGAPFGIVLVVDRLSALLVLLTSLLAWAATLYSSRDHTKESEYFQPLMQFQVMGIHGAFLTGDLFNLFVFFEILLIASYGLVIHGGGKLRTRANLHYVIINLVGSSLFLFALGILYALLGTLNMADMARQVALLPPQDLPLLQVGAALLLIVFGLKAAMAPLYFWLPSAYSAVTAPVAALFAVMTKVGIYALLRVYTLIFSSGMGQAAAPGPDWLWSLAVITLALGTLGAFSAQSLRRLAAYLVVVSVGTLLAGIALASEHGTAALLYYLIHSTLISASLFLLADLIIHQRGKAEDRLVGGHGVVQPRLLGSLFFLTAIAVIGMPPFSGFIGKVLLLNAAATPTAKLWLWPALLLSSLLILVAFARAGSTLFWRRGSPHHHPHPIPAHKLAATLLLLATSPLLALFAGPISDYSAATAAQLHHPHGMIEILLPTAGGAP